MLYLGTLDGARRDLALDSGTVSRYHTELTGNDSDNVLLRMSFIVTGTFCSNHFSLRHHVNVCVQTIF